MLQTLQLAGLNGSGGSPLAASATASAPPFTGLEFVEIAAGTVHARRRPRTGFAYDNERPRHRTAPRGLRPSARTPVTNASWLHFAEGGGYERREWWCDEGWAWKEEYDITRPGGWTPDHRAERRLDELVPLDPQPPGRARVVVRGRRLRSRPRGASAHRGRNGRRRRPGTTRAEAPDVSRGETSRSWPACTPTSTSSAGGPAPAGAYPGGRLAGRLPGDDRRRLGVDLEPLRGLPGLRRRPLPRVLRGVLRRPTTGCCAAARGPRGRARPPPTFRNWDFPAAPPDLLGRAARPRRYRVRRDAHRGTDRRSSPAAPRASARPRCAGCTPPAPTCVIADLNEESGQRWPTSWASGRGFIAPTSPCPRTWPTPSPPPRRRPAACAHRSAARASAGPNGSRAAADRTGSTRSSACWPST